MSEQTKNPNSKDTLPEAGAQESAPEITLEQLDSLLAEEDPSFANEFAAIKSEKFEANIDVEDFDSVDVAIEENSAVPKKSHSGFTQFIHNRKVNFIAAVKGVLPFILGLVSGFFGKIFGSIGAFFKMPAKQKGVVLLAVGLSVMLLAILLRGVGDSVLPRFELKFLTSFSGIADRSFKIEKDESFEDFDNPLRHPDFVVLIERLVVNLRPSESSENPMGMFEFYIEASTQEGAIEINERQKELRDLMARTLEVATHSELASAEGKEKMKLNLRRELNTLLTQGRVRRVYFKTIILKP